MNAYQAGQKALCGDYFQYTPSGASQFQKAGRWTTVPSRGYVAFFYSKSLGRISHVGIVVMANRKQNGTWDITTTTANQLVNELRSCPIPSQPVYGNQPIFTCPGNGCGCGCNS